MKVLLDTNIVIHRENPTIVNSDIGLLFSWIDNLKYSKYIHPVTESELLKNKDAKALESLKVKLQSYNVIKAASPIETNLQLLAGKLDKTPNDHNDTLLLNELINDRVDILITEDQNIHTKARLLGFAAKVFSIESFIEKVTAENPDLIDYKVLAVRKEFFGNLDINDEFFQSFKEDYAEFEKWRNGKAQEPVYVCVEKGKIIALLYIKIEGPNENYSDIQPPFERKKRLKIGTFKVSANGIRLGERFLKIVFDNAIKNRVDEIYVTIFPKRIEQGRLVGLLQEYGFVLHGKKISSNGEENVYKRDFSRKLDPKNPKHTFPYFQVRDSIFLVSIRQEYHTELLPDSILRTESPSDFEKNESHRNSISKVFISRSLDRNIQAGDIIVFYRMGGYYKAVVTTVGIVENVLFNIPNEQEFLNACRKRSVFSDKELLEHWNYNKSNRPFVVNFVYAYSFPKRINLKKLIELGIIRDVNSAPRGFERISRKQFATILRECETDAHIVVD